MTLFATFSFPGSSTESDYLFVWAGDADRLESDFLAVIDLRATSASYAQVIATLPVGRAGGAHHTEHQMPAGGVLFANAFDAGRTYLLDLNVPEAPRVASSFGSAGGLSHPHSFERLPSGNVLGTFQNRGWATIETGGLVELDQEGRVVRAASASAPEVDPSVRPYSLAIVPELDRVVSTGTDMRDWPVNRSVQIWRLSDLTLRRTLVLQPGPRGTESAGTAEPRVLHDGRTVLVSTFCCGLYWIRDLEGPNPRAELVYSFPFDGEHLCGLPVVTERFWVQTVPSENALISVDVSDPRRPREVDRLTLSEEEYPHWISLERGGERIVVTGKGGLEHRVLIARIDRSTGALRLDEDFRQPGSYQPGVRFDRASWPHGENGPAIPHGAVFSRS